MEITNNFTNEQKEEIVNNLTDKEMFVTAEEIFVTAAIPRLPGIEKQIEKLTPYDMEVHDAICTLYKAGNKVFTLGQVLKVLGGTATGIKEKKPYEAIRASITKMQKTKIKITISVKEAKACGGDALIRTTRAILPVTETTWLYREQVMDGYLIQDKPILFLYAETIKQVLQIPADMLRCKHVATTKKSITITSLIKGVLPMMSKKKAATLSLERIYKETGSTSKDGKACTRKCAEKILDDFKENGVIIDYKKKKSGLKIKSYDIWGDPRRFANPTSPTIGESAPRQMVSPLTARQQFTELAESTQRQLERLTPYDMAVHNAICALYLAGYKYITNRQVLEVVGASAKGAAREQLEAIRKSVEKMHNIRITMVNSEKEAKAYNKPILLSREGYMLDFTIFSRKWIDVYQLSNEPMLLRHPETKEQVLATPLKKLKPKRVSTTEKILIIELLIQETRLPMCLDGKPARLSLDKVYSETGSESNDKKAGARRIIKRILGKCQESGVIKGYEAEKDGATIKNYVIW